MSKCSIATAITTAVDTDNCHNYSYYYTQLKLKRSQLFRWCVCVPFEFPLTTPFLADFSFPPRISGASSCGMLREFKLVVNYRHFGTICWSHIQGLSSRRKLLDCLTLKDGTNVLSRNVGDQTPTYATSKKNKDLSLCPLITTVHFNFLFGSLFPVEIISYWAVCNGILSMRQYHVQNARKVTATCTQ